MKNIKVVLIFVVFILITTAVMATATVDPKKLPPTMMEAVYKLGATASGGYTTALRDGQVLKFDSDQDFEVGDIVEYVYEPVWSIFFTNCGEAGGVGYDVANFYSTGIINDGYRVTKKVYLENEKRYGFKMEKIQSQYGMPLTLINTFKFSGGADGEFTLDGDTVMYMVEGGARIYDPSAKRYYEVKDWQKGFQTVAEEKKEYVCTVAGLSGEIHWSPTGERNSYRLLQFGEKLPENAHIRTEEESHVILTFPDMSTYTMKEESHIVLTTDPNTKKSKLSIAAGRVWVDVKKMLTTGSMEVEMQQAVCGIKGTTFVCEEIDGVSTLKVIEGTVEFTSKLDGKAVLVEGGQQVLADSQGLSDISSFDASSETADWAAIEALAISNIPSIDEEQSKPIAKSALVSVVGAVGGVILLVLIILTMMLKKRKKASSAVPQTEQTSIQSELDLNFCIKCGQKITPGAGFCAGCGNRVR